MVGNFLHHRIADPHTLHTRSMEMFEREHLGGKLKEKEREAIRFKKIKNDEWHLLPGTEKHDAPPLHDLAGLNCEDHGGPSNDLAAEMVYWSDIPSDSEFRSPIGLHDTEKKYLTFEPDGGGFNNIRMSLETIILMAHAMGRTLVMPPSQGMYLLRKDRDKQKVHFSFDDFYHMEQVGYEHAGLDIISMEQFLLEVAMTGNLKNKTSGIVAFPPDNRTNWDGIDPKPLKEYLRDATLAPLDWNPGSCLAAFPSDDGPEHFEELNGMMEEVKKNFPRWTEFKNNPVPVDASPLERMREAVGGQVRKLCIYDENMQKAPVVHFMCYHKLRVRMLTHFYSFLYFEDWKHDLWSKRFVRDHLRYSDEIQCAAARIVAALRERARKRDPKGNPHGEYDSFHIRRGDFQYKATRLEAEEIYENVKDELTEGATVFIATDHAGKPFFKPLANHYDIVFLKDFKKELEGVNTNYYGMIDQLVASRGRIFFGCYHSTFSGFIFRIRGYHSQKDKLPGFEQGTLHHSFYYSGQKDKNLYTEYTPIKPPYFSREFPTSWRDIDKGIDELSQGSSEFEVESE
eukprot:CAMPEP_0171329334 /NCGR_PEP_ID=MMETSP0878-20121228/1199_1 /TAXON_ID=67004 /ORGANISM="Thalassiosira weissflogii, Strain CCMP1336" /LENGTH=569 /DNA_ID=CAMNT_0011829301 /DNA_START=239 /DNA_END=1948 /DNA_ORIENTATION=+